MLRGCQHLDFRCGLDLCQGQPTRSWPAFTVIRLLRRFSLWDRRSGDCGENWVPLFDCLVTLQPLKTQFLGKWCRFGWGLDFLYLCLWYRLQCFASQSRQDLYMTDLRNWGHPDFFGTSASCPVSELLGHWSYFGLKSPNCSHLGTLTVYYQPMLKKEHRNLRSKSGSAQDADALSPNLVSSTIQRWWRPPHSRCCFSLVSISSRAAAFVPASRFPLLSWLH